MVTKSELVEELQKYISDDAILSNDGVIDDVMHDEDAPNDERKGKAMQEASEQYLAMFDHV